MTGSEVNSGQNEVTADRTRALLEPDTWVLMP